MKSQEFFSWAQSRGLNDAKAIANAMGVSNQTIRNWKSADELPGWVSYACVTYDRSKENPEVSVPTMTFVDFERWKNRNGMSGYPDVARTFNITRQAVHNWFKRKKLPRYIARACVGFEIVKTAQP
jgi:DNA-binding transcriptional regulator YiaG